MHQRTPRQEKNKTSTRSTGQKRNVADDEGEKNVANDERNINVANDERNRNVANGEGERSVLLVFTCLVACRVLSALVQPISDCDEVFNYWEPTHLLLYPSKETQSFQTWEYSPQFALRSYLYLLIHALIGKFWSLLLTQVATKATIFFAIRVTVASFCAWCETVFVRGISVAFGSRIAKITFIFLLFSSGMFNAAASYLPSTFTMYFLMLALGHWYHSHQRNYTGSQTTSNSSHLTQALIYTAIAGLIGWPFCIVAIVPFGLDLIVRMGVASFIKQSIVALVLLLSAVIGTDYLFYRKIMFTPLNLLMYNRGSGSQLYGVEPWYFYVKNLLLNFNVASLLALVSPLLVLIGEPRTHTSHGGPSRLQKLMMLSPYFIWTIFMSVMPHKEERFLFLVYPTLCLSAAVALDYLVQWASSFMSIITINTTHSAIAVKSQLQNHKSSNNNNRLTVCAWILLVIIVVVFLLASVSRSVAIVRYYGAPLSVYSRLHDHLAQHGTNHTIICVGKEWYRFPSGFFIPNSKGRLGFVKSKFNGLLPIAFDVSHSTVGDGTGSSATVGSGSGTSYDYSSLIYATSNIPIRGLNNQNREEMGNYVELDACDYMVDFDFEGQAEPHYALDQQTWQTVYQEPFLDQTKSPMLSRALWIPFQSAYQNVYGSYVLLKRRNKP